MGTDTPRTHRALRQDIMPVNVPARTGARLRKKRLTWPKATLVLPFFLQFPRLARRLKKLPKLPKLPRKLLLPLIILCVGLLAFGAYLVTITHTNVIPGDGTAIAKKSHTPVSKTPDYSTLLPTGKTITDLGGWTRVSPPDRNPVFAYIDKIGINTINVSQQPLPDDFKPDTDVQVEQLAQGYKASEKVTVGSTIVHIGTSAKGPQTVIFYKDNLLILIKSSVQIDSSQWASYVNSLQ